MREITEQVDPPRSLFVDHKLGYTLGRPGEAIRQRAILERALEMLHKDAGLLETWEE